MKKFFSWVILLCVVFTGFSSSVQAEGEVRFSLSAAGSLGGERLYVTLSADEAADIASFKFSVIFDKSVLMPESIERTQAFSEGIFNSNLQDPNADRENMDKVTVFFANAKNYASGGAAAKITFKILQKKDTNITLTFNKEDMLDENTNIVSVLASGTGVKLSESSGGGSGSGGSSSGSGGSSGGSGANTSEADKPADSAFCDMQGHWAEEYAEYLAGKGIFSGYDDNTFRPGEYITRQEAAVCLAKLLDVSKESGAQFTDDSDIAPWAKGAVYAMAKEGYFSGYEDGSFRPLGKITREEFASVLARTIEGASFSGEEKEFSDAEHIGPWAKEAVDKMRSLGIINGYDDNTFRPKASISRAETAAVIYKYLEK